MDGVMKKSPRTRSKQLFGHGWQAVNSGPSKRKTKPSRLEPFVPNRSHVLGVLDALKAAANLPGSHEAPCWLAKNDLPEANDVIAFENGLLDLGTYLSGRELDLLQHTPTWFSFSYLPHAFDQNAKCPQWIDFLNEVFSGDQERIRSLAQWFGYNLTHDNRQQTYFLLVGPPRSGKGTAMTVFD